MTRKTRPPQRSDSGDAFIPESDQKNGTQDDLAEHLAEQFERSVATGDPDDVADDNLQLEEIGGPFIESAADQEFGSTRTSTDDGEPSAVPEAVGSLAVASAEEEQEAVEEDVERGGTWTVPTQMPSNPPRSLQAGTHLQRPGRQFDDKVGSPT